MTFGLGFYIGCSLGVFIGFCIALVCSLGSALRGYFQRGLEDDDT